MKKTILLALATATAFAANAQHGSEFVSFKPKKGDVTAEFGLTGGILNSDFTKNEGSNGLLRGRIFLKNNLALRGGFDLGVSSETTNIYGVGTQVGESTETFTKFNLNVGIEKHFKGTHRLSPYVGGDIVFGVVGYNLNNENTDGTSYYNNYSSEVKGPADVKLGIRGVMGADYYFAKNVYLGVEAGLQIANTFGGERSVTVNNGGSTTTTTFKPVKNNFDIGTSIVTGVRLGFVF